jgi:hypothetical protein
MVRLLIDKVVERVKNLKSEERKSIIFLPDIPTGYKTKKYNTLQHSIGDKLISKTFNTMEEAVAFQKSLLIGNTDVVNIGKSFYIIKKANKIYKSETLREYK